MTVQLGHPDAFVAMKNAGHEVKNHFAAPPFQTYELQQIPERTWWRPPPTSSARP